MLQKECSKSRRRLRIATGKKHQKNTHSATTYCELPKSTRTYYVQSAQEQHPISLSLSVSLMIQTTRANLCRRRKEGGGGGGGGRILLPSLYPSPSYLLAPTQFLLHVSGASHLSRHLLISQRKLAVAAN